MNGQCHWMSVQLLVCLLLVILQAAVATSSSSSPKSKSILLLDVDNTLYVEKYHGIEAQIVTNIHRFVASEFLLDHNNPLFGTKSRNVADDLHHQFGSTLEGLRQTVWKNLSPAQLQDKQRAFYESVYSNIDCTSLLFPHCRVPEDNDTTAAAGTKTGYSHDGTGNDNSNELIAQHQHAVRRMLQSVNSKNCELHVTSNSPVQHIQRIIQAMGLANVPWTRVWTPDHPPHRDDSETTTPTTASFRDDPTYTATTTIKNAYPTKLHPREFWGPKFLAENQENTVILIDDSATTLEACAQEARFQTIKVSSSSDDDDDRRFPSSLQQALAVAMGWLTSEYQFSDVDYLRAKNAVDRHSIHGETWRQMITELTHLLLSQQQRAATTSTLTIVDVGAGLLSMLNLILVGSNDDNGDDTRSSAGRLPSVLRTLQENGVSLKAGVQYYAYEPNQGLESACVEQLESLGFVRQTSQHQDGKEVVFVRPANQPDQQPLVTVHLRFWDYKESHRCNTQHIILPHLIVGCCFADLLQPYDLVMSLMRCFLSNSHDGFTHSLVYFPITFGGVTQFLPPQPFETSLHGDTDRMIPSDTTAFALYSKALTELHGHNLDPHRIESAMSDYGGICLGCGQSNWMIDPLRHNYLWRTMQYFFGTVAAPRLQAAGWNARGWLDRARILQPTIHVTNVDLLFRVPRLGEWRISEVTAERTNGSRDSVSQRQKYDEILFIGPRQVTSVQKEAVAELQSNEIRIQTECSLISSGTELKIFKGHFDDAALDLNIKGMDEERMAYPLAYGYSLVGHVVECGAGVEDADELLGKRVFTFSSHASQVVTDRSAVQIVPGDIPAVDAIFMPSVETALSLVQDARPLFGEKVAVFGQGLIGLLVTALLRKHATDSSGRFGTVSTFDTLPDRLAASAAMGASQALLPTESIRAGPFDVAIEVSGNSRALQTAIDSTRKGGRIVIGSWYGNADMPLKLGIDFHRSHKTIKASQVSEIPAEVTKTWSKERRFALTWELVKSIRPSQLITRRTSLGHAQEAYCALENGNELVVAFEYR